MAQPISDSQDTWHASSTNGPRIPDTIPRLEAPIYIAGDTSMRDTPDVSAEMRNQLHITESTSDEDDEDSIPDSDSSLDEEELAASTARAVDVAELPTGLCYDERMRYHAEVSATTGENVHPEDPRRIYYIYKELCEAGLVADSRFSKLNLIARTPLLRIDAREATKEECCLVHTEKHYEFVKHTAGMSSSQLEKLSQWIANECPWKFPTDLNDEELIDLSEDIHMDSIYFNSLSYFSAKLSAGAAIDTCRAVVSRKVKNAIAVIRPPGHHAEVQSTMGFCLFNNVCVASRVCQQDFGPSCRKILILDWDVHHGNGCQKAFYDDPNILYISIHVHMDGRFYPSGNDGAMDKVGLWAGEGKNVNIPWPTKGMGDGDYMYAFQHVVMPIGMEFDPDLVIVAAGFDAAAGDELGGCFVSPACYAHMTHMLMSLANGKVAVCLEGGYNFAAISKSALEVTRTLMGEPPDRLYATQATDIAIQTVEQVRQIQSRYWNCLVPKEPVGEAPRGRPLHDILRQSQAIELYEKFKMTELHLLRDTISKSFQKQILATRDYWDQDYLLVIFHDAPEVRVPGGQTSTLQPAHTASIIDNVEDYIAEAIAHDFGVIDINIPEYITLPSTASSGLEPEEAARARTFYNSNTDALDIPYAGAVDLARQDSARLATYIWQNYIEPYNFFPESIILMGCGHAFHAVARLMSELPGEAVYQSPIRERDLSLGGTTTGMLAGVVGFISTNPVRPVQNSATPWVSEWYKKNSLVFVGEGHAIFRREGKKSRKYGNLVKVEDGSLGAIMQRKNVMEQAWKFMLDRVRYNREESDEEDDSERKSGGGEESGEVQEPVDTSKSDVKVEAAEQSEVRGQEITGEDDVVMSTEK